MLIEGNIRANIKKQTSNKRPIGPPPSMKLNTSKKQWNDYLQDEYLEYLKECEFDAYSEGWLDGTYPQTDRWTPEMWKDMLNDWNESKTKLEREKMVEININELADFWEGYLKTAMRHNHTSYNEAYRECISDLKEALPVWTQITDDEETWPDEDQMVVIFHDLDPEIIEFGYTPCDNDRELLTGAWWRPVCDLDYPPIGRRKW